MAAHTTIVRDAIKTKIEGVRDQVGSPYVYTDFQVEAVHIPIMKAADPAAQLGKLFLVGLTSNDLGQLSRPSNTVNGPISKRQIYINVGFVVPNVSPDAISQIDMFIELCEQFRDTCRKLQLQSYAWDKNVAMSFDEATPYNYTGLRETRCFESYFTAHYTVVLQ